MALFIVTVKIPKNPEHNPREKKTGPCPVNGKPCTDVTGEHHTLLFLSERPETTAEDVRAYYQADYHVTRVECA